MVPEDKWRTSKAKIIFPVHPLKLRWDMFILLVIIYSCVIVPFRIGMSADAVGRMWWLEFGITICFMTDLILNFNTAYLYGANWVVDRGMIAQNYARTWLIVDALSSFPVELVDLLTDPDAIRVHPDAPVGYDPSTIQAADDENFGLKLLRALRMVRLLRMLKLLNVNKYIDALEDRFGVNMQILHIMKMVFALLYLMHLLGCLWFFVGTHGDHAATWLSEYDGGSGMAAPTHIQYLYSVYWALTTLTTVGYGDITPANNAERCYTLVSLLIGALVFGYLLSSIGNLLSNMDKNAVKLDAKLDEVKDFTRWHKMEPDLAGRVRRYCEFFYSRKSAMDEESIISNLAPSLRREVVRHLLEKTVARIPMFSQEYCSYADDEFQLEVHPLLKPLVYEAHEVVVAKGTCGDDLYFLNRGTVAAVSSIDDRILYPISDPGSFFGEHILCQEMPADLPYKAHTRSEFFCLAKKDLYELLERFPHARAELAEFVFEDLLRHKMLRFWAFKMCVSERTGEDPRAIAALQLQVSWIRKQIIELQDTRAKHGNLEWLMPGIFGLSADGSTTASPTPRSRISTARAAVATHAGSRGGAGAAEGPPSTRRAPGAADGAEMRRLFSSLEGERLKLKRREEAMERQLQSIQQSLAQLAAAGRAPGSALTVAVP